MSKKKKVIPTDNLVEENARLKTEIEVIEHKAEKRGDFKYDPYTPEQIAAMVEVCKSSRQMLKLVKDYGRTFGGEQLSKDLERLLMVGVDL